VTQTDNRVDRDKVATRVALGVAGVIGVVAAAMVALAMTVTPPPGPAAGEQAVADAGATVAAAHP
jgi:NhaP-type Na+/H+ or K+/H+ antiporter